MNKTKVKWIFCRVVMRLDWIPRYGRFYRVHFSEDSDGKKKTTLGPARWTWQRRGRWGMYLLDRMGLMWWFIDEGIRRQDASSRSTLRRDDDRD